MSKCDLIIDLDSAKRVFLPGEVIRGVVEVVVNSEVRCDGLTLTSLWQTHGRGNRRSGGEQAQELFRGTWLAGETHHYPFEVVAPEGPVTYHGHYLNVDHYLRATADIPWALDPKAEEEFVLELPPGATGYRQPGEPDAVGEVSATAAKVGQAIGAVFGGCFMIPGLIALVVGVGVVAKGELGGILPIVMGTIFTAVGGLVVFLALRNTLAERKLGEVLVAVKPERAAPGEEVSVQLQFSPRSRVQLNRVTARLVGKEVVVSGSGTNRTTHTHELARVERELSGECMIHAGEGVDLDATFTVPPDAPLSFHASDNDLRWTVEVHVDIPGWPDWTKDVPLVVAP